MSADPCVDIYALCDPRTGEIRYIGKADNAAKRLKRHIMHARRRKTPVYSWFKSLADHGLKPTVVVLRKVPLCEWQQAERDEIAAARASGTRLLNVAAGGEDIPCSASTRKANGSRVAQERLKYVWLASRRMGENSRWVEQNVGDEAAQRCRAKHAKFLRLVELHKKAGTINDLNERLGALMITNGWHRETSRAA